MTITKLIYVIDDSPAVCALYQELLIDAGYRVKIFESGIKVMQQLGSDKPHAVILDVSMPWLSGLDLSIVIKNDAVLRNTPIIIVTGRTREELGNKLWASQAGYYLHKSEVQDKLVALVQSLPV